MDLIEKRSDVFLDAIQDACFVVLRRSDWRRWPNRSASVAASGVFGRDGEFVSKGVAHIETNGAPWRLPGVELVRSSTLKDWGYRATVGYLVANRQPDAPAQTMQPRGDIRSYGPRRLLPRKPSTSNAVRPSKATVGLMRPQMRPMWFALRALPFSELRREARSGGSMRRAISKAFIEKHGGVIAENHVILLVPNSPDAASPRSRWRRR